MTQIMQINTAEPQYNKTLGDSNFLHCIEYSTVSKVTKRESQVHIAYHTIQPEKPSYKRKRHKQLVYGISLRNTISEPNMQLFMSEPCLENVV